MKPQTLKGFRDFGSQEATRRQYIADVLQGVFESYGFGPLETPTLEYDEILSGKYGQEGDRLMYRFTDRGGRAVAMRYDLTVPLARYVAQNQGTLPTPFKRYQVQPVWRADNPQRGRYREFVQCDIDIVGVSTALADAEILVLINEAYRTLGFEDFSIKINDRQIFEGIPKEAIIIVDKLAKIGESEVRRELKEAGLESQILDQIAKAKVTPRLEKIISRTKKMGVLPGQISFTPTLARGLDYYTGLIIEVTVANYTAGSVGGGGRYDRLIGMFGTGDIPAAGFSFGFDRIYEALAEQDKFPKELSASTTRILVTIFDTNSIDQSIGLVKQLKEKGIAAELYLDPDKKLDKQLKYADRAGIPYAAIIGPDETKRGVVQVKDMQTTKQEETTIEQLIRLLT